MRFSADELALARSSPAGLGHVVTGGTRDQTGAYRPFEHLVHLNDALLAAVHEQDQVLAGESRGGEWDRLIVAMPPRHGKSETTSKYTPAWYLGRRPKRRVILTSYQAQFAATWGRKARDLLEEHGREVFDVEVSDSSARADEWEIARHGGGMTTAGVGGAITGKGAELFIIDDPTKNSQDATSETIRSTQKEWWKGTARTRLHKGAIVVVVATRWHEDDLPGWLLEQDRELAEDEREGWKVIEFPAIAEPDAETGETYDALGREPGQALCPELGYDVAWAKRTKAAVGSYFWSALYQQRPRPADGMLFKHADFRYWEPHPTEAGLLILHEDDGIRTQALEHCTLFETVDVAASEKQTADFTVISKWAVTPTRDLVLVDRRRQRFEILDVGGFVKAAHTSGELTSLPDHIQWPGWSCPRASFVDVESFGHGLTVVQELVPQGYPIRKVVPDVDKVSRALVAVARYEEHRVFHPRLARWRREWEDELLAFPTGRNDDQVDTASMAAIRLPQVVVGRSRARGDRESRSRMAGVRGKAL